MLVVLSGRGQRSMTERTVRRHSASSRAARRGRYVRSRVACQDQRWLIVAQAFLDLELLDLTSPFREAEPMARRTPRPMCRHDFKGRYRVSSVS